MPVQQGLHGVQHMESVDELNRLVPHVGGQAGWIARQPVRFQHAGQAFELNPQKQAASPHLLHALIATAKFAEAFEKLLAACRRVLRELFVFQRVNRRQTRRTGQVPPPNVLVCSVQVASEP